jgi:DNA-binding NtrC family response regulator
MNDSVIGPTEAPKRSQAPPRHRILVADDENTVIQLMTVALTRSGYHVEAAEDGDAAWEALQANPYDLLITDNKMPKVTGIELVKNLRSARMALPVIMVTGTIPTHELAQDPSLQLAATLEKPFAIADLLDSVENVLRATEGSREQFNPLPHGRRQPSGDVLQL